MRSWTGVSERRYAGTSVGLDAGHRGECPVLVGIRLEGLDLLLHVAAGDVAGAAVQTGGAAADAAYGVRGFGGSVGEAEAGGAELSFGRRLGEGVRAGSAAAWRKTSPSPPAGRSRRPGA